MSVHASLVGPAARLLEVDDLVVEYPARGFGKKPFRALHGVSLDIRPGETVGLVGESGSGKTTLGRAVLGLAPVTGGAIRFEAATSATSRARSAGPWRPTSGRVPGPVHVAQPGDDHRAESSPSR